MAYPDCKWQMVYLHGAVASIPKKHPFKQSKAELRGCYVAYYTDRLNHIDR